MLAKKAIVNFAIEQALLDVGGNAMLDLVSDMLFSKYHCNVGDCYEKPQYLNHILHEIFGTARLQILESIKNNLDEFVDVKPIKEFLYIINN